MASTEKSSAGADRLAAAKKKVLEQYGAGLADPLQRAKAVADLERLDQAFERELGGLSPPSDGGIGALLGLGGQVTNTIGGTDLPLPQEQYEDTVTSERIRAVGDLYYLYQHEAIGVFRAVVTLRKLFESGSVRLSDGAGAFALYRFDRRQALRFTGRERLRAYRRVFGYGKSAPPPGAQPNTMFNQLFVAYLTEVAQFFRDKRVSEVVKERPNDPTFGSIAVVRRSGLDLRNNLKTASYGNVQVLRVEALQLLRESFDLLAAEDIRSLFGADDAWEVIEEIHERYLGVRHIDASARNRMGRAGRDILRWLGEQYIQESSRDLFEVHLELIADSAEEWLTSAETLKARKRKRPLKTGPTRLRSVG